MADANRAGMKHRMIAGACLLLAQTPTRADTKVPRIEVAFVLDATGSMGPYIAEARSRIKEIADELATGTPKPDVRFALVTYRDRGDDYVTHIDKFTTKLDAIKSELDATKAAGGGDTPESVLEGLDAAVHQLDWSDGDGNVMKLAYLVGDAEAHHYPDGPTEAQVTDAARKRGIVIHTIECGTGMGIKGEQTWEALARLTEGRTMKLSDRGRTVIAGGGTSPSTSFAAGVGSTAKAYSSAVGVDYGSAPNVTLAPVPGIPALPAGAKSGLEGAQVRWIADPLAWSDLWAAHTSVWPDKDKTPPPAVDFAKFHVLVVGGADAGLSIDVVKATSAGTAATLRGGSPGVQFLLVPVGGAS